MRNTQPKTAAASVVHTAPGLLKLGACFIYDALIVIAISFACSGLFIWLVGDATQGIKRYALQLALWLVIGLYFVWCWVKSGQTLALKTWRLKLVNRDASLLTVNHAIGRYMLATFSLMLFGLGFLWAIVDRERLYLHDRLLKSKIITIPKNY